LSSYFNISFGFLANLVLIRLLVPEAFGTFALAGFAASAFVLISLSNIGRLTLLRERFPGGVLIPPAVWRG
jgi:hypothetical protein